MSLLPLFPAMNEVIDPVFGHCFYRMYSSITSVKLKPNKEGEWFFDLTSSKFRKIDTSHYVEHKYLITEVCYTVLTQKYTNIGIRLGQIISESHFIMDSKKYSLLYGNQSKQMSNSGLWSRHLWPLLSTMKIEKPKKYK